MGYFKNLVTEKQEDERLFRRDMDLQHKLLERIREGEFDRRFEGKLTKYDAGVDCPDCGGLGYTVEENSHGEYMQGCPTCWIKAQEADHG